MRSLDASIAIFVYSFRAIILWHRWVVYLCSAFQFRIWNSFETWIFVGPKAVINPLVTFVEHIITYLYILWLWITIMVNIELNFLYIAFIYYPTSMYVLNDRLYTLAMCSWLLFSKSFLPLLIKEKKNYPYFHYKVIWWKLVKFPQVKVTTNKLRNTT